VSGFLRDQVAPSLKECRISIGKDVARTVSVFLNMKVELEFFLNLLGQSGLEI